MSVLVINYLITYSVVAETLAAKSPSLLGSQLPTVA